MSFRAIDCDIMIRGTILASLERLFPSGIPTLEEYGRANGVAASSFRRSAAWLLGLLPGLLGRRRPGPQSAAAARDDGEDERQAGKLADLRSWLRELRSPSAKNTCYDGEAKRRIKSLAEEIHAGGVMDYEEIARSLGLTERQLLRIRRAVEEAGGEAPRPESRRPHQTGELSGEIQNLIANIAQSADSRHPYTPSDVKRILKKNYKEKLLEHHGSETISLTTVAKYLGAPTKDPDGAEHPRGNYRYPEPFQQVAMDTSLLELYGRVFYLVAVFELGGRLNLLTRVFLRETTREVVEVTEEFLGRYPQVEVALMDRGKPYLNDEVRSVIESRGKLRLVAPPATPEAKAAAERHFRTLKEVILPAIESVFPEDPGWSPAEFGKLVQVAVEVFRKLYPHIAQEGIDGKSPLERASSFDPLRAAARSRELFERSMNSEPVDGYVRELHRRFQLPGVEAESVRRLRQFGTATLRILAREVAAYMGPPQPGWMYDPLGYLAATARTLAERRREAFLEERFQEEQAKRMRAEAEAQRSELQAEAIQYQDHPERFVDRALRTLVVALGLGLGISRSAEDLKDLLVSLSRKLGGAFSAEVSRLKDRIASFAKNAELRAKAEAQLQEILASLTG